MARLLGGCSLNASVNHQTSKQPMKSTPQTIDRRLSPAGRFFFEHAGYCYDPQTQTKQEGRRQCAIALAEAEEEVSKRGFTFEWEQDGMTNSEWTDEGPEYYTWNCCLRDENGKIVGSLCGCDFGPEGKPWGNPYMRVVQAEIALEAI